MKHVFTTLLLTLCACFAYAQKIVIDPTLTLAAGAPASEVLHVEGFRFGTPAFTFDRITYDPEIFSLIVFIGEDGSIKESLSIIIHKNQKKFSVQYIYRNSANRDAVWFRISNAKLTLNQPFKPGAALVGELRFHFSGSISNAAGQPEKVSGTVLGKFSGTVPAK